MMRVKATNESDFTSSCWSWALNSHAHTIRLFLHPSKPPSRKHFSFRISSARSSLLFVGETYGHRFVPFHFSGNHELNKSLLSKTREALAWGRRVL